MIKNGQFYEHKNSKRVYCVLDVANECATDKQKWFLSKTEGLGYKTAVCYSANEAIKTIQDYYDASH